MALLERSHYAIRVEFQVRGSPHIHSFLWVLNAPNLTKDNIDEYVRFVDAIIKAYVPDINENPELHKLVTTYQIHSHSKPLPENRFRICRSKEEIDELPEDSVDVFKRNMVDRYLDRPNLTFSNRKFGILDSFCFAEFVAHYYLLPKQSNDYVNDSQPAVLQELILEINHSACNYPSTIPLMNSKEKLKCRQVKAILRYYVPNRHKYPEKYAHHLLFMLYPFRNEQDLKSNITETYSEKLREPGVIDIINTNKQIFEPCGDLVESALLNLCTNLPCNQDSCKSRK